MSYEFVISLSEVVASMKKFMSDVENQTEIIEQLSQFRHWYFIEEKESGEIQYFGPSKFIGYKEMDVEKYSRGFAKNGGETEKVLGNWFVELNQNSDKSRKLVSGLELYMQNFEKKPNKSTRIHVLKNGINRNFE